MTPLWKLDVSRDVQIMKWGLAALVTLIGLFFFTLYQPDMKELRRDVANVQSGVAGQTEALKSQGEAIRDMNSTLREMRLDRTNGNQPQRSPQSR